MLSVFLPSQASALWGRSVERGGSALFLLNAADAYTYSPYFSYSLLDEEASVPWMCFDIRTPTYKKSRLSSPPANAGGLAPEAPDAETVVISIPASGPSKSDCRERSDASGELITCGKRRGEKADGAKPAIARPSSLIVFPFKNETGDASLEWLSAAMQDLFTRNLGYIEGLKVIPLRDYPSASAPRQPRDARLSVKALSLHNGGAAAKYAKKLSAGQVWLGSYRKAAPEVIEVEVRGLDSGSAKEVFRKKAKAPLSRLIAAGDKLLMEILRDMLVDLGPNTLLRLMSAKTDSLPAWRNYSKGLEALSADLLWEAIVEDPEYAEAWDGMGWALMRAGDYRGAEQAFSYALKLKPHMPDARAGLKLLDKTNR